MILNRFELEQQDQITNEQL